MVREPHGKKPSCRYNPPHVLPSSTLTWSRRRGTFTRSCHLEKGEKREKRRSKGTPANTAMRQFIKARICPCHPRPGSRRDAKAEMPCSPVSPPGDWPRDAPAGPASGSGFQPFTAGFLLYPFFLHEPLDAILKRAIPASSTRAGAAEYPAETATQTPGWHAQPTAQTSTPFVVSEAPTVASPAFWSRPPSPCPNATMPVSPGCRDTRSTTTLYKYDAPAAHLLAALPVPSITGLVVSAKLSWLPGQCITSPGRVCQAVRLSRISTSPATTCQSSRVDGPVKLVPGQALLEPVAARSRPGRFQFPPASARIHV